VKAERLNAKLTVLEKLFEARGLPMRERPLEAFKAVHGSVRDQERRSALFQPIYDWYHALHGDKVSWDGIMGRVPVLIKGELYLAAVDFVMEDVKKDYRESIEGLAANVAESLGLEDFRTIGSRTVRAHGDFKALETLNADDCFLSIAQRELLQRARFDLRSSVNELKINENTQGSIFNSHAAAEKYLKAALLQLDKNARPESYGHGVKDLLRDIVVRDERFSGLDNAVAELGQKLPDMNIRYKAMPRSVDNAITAFYASLNVCSGVSTILRFDDERKSRRSAFQPGAYYINAHDLSFWCFDASPSGAKVIGFDERPLRRLKPTPLAVRQVDSGFYLKVESASRAAEMGAALSKLANAPNIRRHGEAQEWSSIRGPEGSYILGFSRRLM
jgi:hypothetical protein